MERKKPIMIIVKVVLCVKNCFGCTKVWVDHGIELSQNLNPKVANTTLVGVSNLDGKEGFTNASSFSLFVILPAHLHDAFPVKSSLCQGSQSQLMHQCV
ncbi:hypothetical protein VNO77_03235 [Canavalia gladiata]|uniref:Uncharacterized protein n=1 Tax=Canavalia gladiata TaxID=3824 RepID=A0AAN9R7Y6_CANGL